MRNDSPTSVCPVNVGARNSKLSRIQTEHCLEFLRNLFPLWVFKLQLFSSPGDRDRKTSLVSDAPADFFTCDLDDALLDKTIDLAVHSAKDLPNPLRSGLSWLWLPFAEDPRDGLICRPGETPASMHEGARVGVSSPRRQEFIEKNYPHLTCKSIRGNVEQRIEQLDAHKYDMLILAAAGLNRLDMADRITEYISLQDLPPPPGQGRLALTWKADNSRMTALTSLFLKPVILAGGGPGCADLVTVAAQQALQECDICFYDALVDPAVLENLSLNAEAFYVGKRAGEHSMKQEEICSLLVEYARRGKRVVRLKGGDPGIFGRLAEELHALETNHIPYYLIPGVGSLNYATLINGITLTGRDANRGFTVTTPSVAGGKLADISANYREKLPGVFFMATAKLEQIVQTYHKDGFPPETPICAIRGEKNGGFRIDATLETVLNPEIRHQITPPALIIVGSPADPTRRFISPKQPLNGKRILLTGSPHLNRQAEKAVKECGGIPLPCPMIHLEFSLASIPTLERIAEFDMVILTSPSSVNFLAEGLEKAERDRRSLPSSVVCGKGTADALQSFGIKPDYCPKHRFGADELIALLQTENLNGKKILRLVSDQAPEGISKALRQNGASVENCVLYTNSPVKRSRETMPEFDAAFLGSGSAVRALTETVGQKQLSTKDLIPIGTPTATAMKTCNLTPTLIPPEATAQTAMFAYAAHCISRKSDG